MADPIRIVSNVAGVPAIIGNGLSNSDGVQGFSASAGGAGVIGVHSEIGAGVKGVSEKHDGVQGFAKGVDHCGVIGDNQKGVGVKGQSIEHDGVQGFTSNKDRAGVVGTNTGDGNGVLGQCDHSVGVVATSKFGTGIVAYGGRFAAQFTGEVDVAGDLYMTGNVHIKKEFNLYLDGADYAEALTTTDPSVEAGLVVVLGADGEVHPCDQDYDTTVAGIVSGAGGVKPAIVLDRHDDSAHVALMGKVWCMANANAAPIRPGDLLTTSSKSGHCRRVIEPARAFGAVIGKALTALPSGSGLVRVLVSPR